MSAGKRPVVPKNGHGSLINGHRTGANSAVSQGWRTLCQQKTTRAIFCLAVVGALATQAQAQQSSLVYAVEYNQSINRFGTINLIDGKFTKISSLGSAVINDVAYCSADGKLYGISNSTSLVTFNLTNGAMTVVANFSKSGVQSLAFQPGSSTLYGASQSQLYKINLASGKCTSVGSYGSAPRLGSSGQNIRFAQDGNLYLSNTSTNTDIYRISTSSGTATWMGEAVGYPYLMLQNSSSNLYGVFINLGSVTNTPELVTFNLGSFVSGGTNANGSTHQITLNMVGAGTNFPANFNFSGGSGLAVTNLTLPVTVTVAPSNQTCTAGGNATFSVSAAGTGLSYQWLFGGAIIGTGSSLTLNNVTTNQAGTYTVIVSGLLNSVTNSAALTVNVPVTVTAAPTNQTCVVGDNVSFSVTATGTGLSYQWLFGGSVIGAGSNLTLTNVTASQAGTYTVIVNGAAGGATNSATLTVNKFNQTISFASLPAKTYGNAPITLSASASSGLAVSFSIASGPATISGNTLTITGAGTVIVTASQAGNGSFNAAAPTNQSFNVSAANLTVTGIAANNKVYNGNTAATLNTAGASLVGVGGGDSVSLVTSGATGTFADKNIGAGKTVTISGLALSGGSSANYSLAQPAATASITAASLTVSGVTANNKIYDGNMTATLNTAGASLNGVVSGDSVSLVTSAATGTFADKNVGTGKTVTVSGLALAGGGAANYSLTQPAAAGSITAAIVTASVTASNKVYDGTTAATIASRSLTGVVSGDSVSPAGGTASFTDSLVGNGKTVTISGLGIAGAGVGNYTLASSTVTTTADITPKKAADITGIALSPDGRAYIACSGDPGDTYVIEAANDLSHPDWTTISTNTIAPGGVLTVTDLDATNHPARFYRTAPLGN